MLCNKTKKHFTKIHREETKKHGDILIISKTSVELCVIK